MNVPNVQPVLFDLSYQQSPKTFTT